MRLSHFFIERPIFAGVLSVFITLIGIFAYPLLALSQYPDIAPPTVAVIASYPGASAETLAETVAAPLEQEINGVEDMIYMTSSSSNGMVQITVTFQPGTDLDSAQVLVQNRVSLAEPRLPEQVRQVGVTVNKQSTGFLMVVGLTAADDSLDADYVGNYANSTVRERLLRVEGVGEVQIFGGGLYSMRVWIDPGKAAERNLTPNEIVEALRGQNLQAAGGTVGQPPFGPTVANELPVEVQGRLSTPEAFGDVVLRRDAEGRTIRLRDVARVEIGAQDYGVRGYFSGERGVAMAVLQQPGSNALSTAQGVIAALDDLEPSFPSGLAYQIPYNPTEYVAASVAAVQSTLIEAVLLVVLVVVVFLHTWRAAIIPILAIPIALVGTFAVQLALGYSLNSLSLFALVLAVGIVVDDAIVVVENVERNIREGLSPREAAHRSMKEVSGALVAISLVLVAVFVPTAFVSGIPGMFYRQFAVTIAAATVISLLVSLTLSPALAALLLKPHREDD
ncbi:MAG: efflux RND transporter permease subunit, partial [Phenylobacterium sp.]|nr:efflux RND transporter permease subunit [Phenylobacterium sp.]